ncbi:hypothetical protein IZU99_10595 [Oscillospiraceae bacterium CM]|nr:hypothetical protein IZU99_10595 [Oscillospiraceae bacterium CM]
MNEHILISKAKRYDVSKAKTEPASCTFSYRGGYWTDNMSGIPMMLMDDPRRPKPETKKFDVETGEDQKGE